MNTTAIYGLFDPREPRVLCYVGKGLADRAASHWEIFVCDGRAVNKLLLAWFEELRAAGVEPGWRFIEANVPNRKWAIRERFWIAHWRSENPKLCNVTIGGNAFPPHAGITGGRASIAKQRRNGTGFCDPENGRKAGLIGGPIGGRMGNREGKARGGYTTARIPTERKRRTRHMAALGRTGLGGRVAVETGQIKTLPHFHWHVGRGILKDDCTLCREAVRNGDEWTLTAKKVAA